MSNNNENSPKETMADLIWKKIKGVQIDMFAIPNQTIADHVTRKEVSPDVVHLVLKSTAVLPALELALKTIKMPKGQTFHLTSTSKGLVVIEVIHDLS